MKEILPGGISISELNLDSKAQVAEGEEVTALLLPERLRSPASAG